MKKNIFIITLMLISMIFVSSCSKVDDIKQSSSTTDQKSLRMSEEMTNDEMEESILDFISKLEEPEGQKDMDVKEAFEYVEATLNYKYVNYDYSKCANSEEFKGSIDIAPDGNNMMTMSAISLAYDSILNDWSTKYHSVEEDNKTPIVFDITDIENNTVNYTMVVGKGSLDLELYGENFVPPTTTSFFLASVLFNNMTYAHLNNNLIQWMPSGNRFYSPNIAGYTATPLIFPSYALDPLPPNDNGFTDYRLFYSVASNPNHHVDLSTLEFNYYYNQFGNDLMFEMLNSYPNFNYVTFAQISCYVQGQSPNFSLVEHMVEYHFGRRYWTPNGISNL